MKAIPLAILLLGAASVWLGGRFARRMRWPEVGGMTASLCLFALASALIPGGWRAWLSGIETGDAMFNSARGVGLTGLLVLAGLRLGGRISRQTERITWATVAACAVFAAVAAIVLVSTGVDAGAALLTAAALSAASLWLPAEAVCTSANRRVITASTNAVVLLTGCLMLGIHLYFTTTRAFATSRASTSGYFIVASYELLKVALFFSFACFVVVKFIDRSEGRISKQRMAIAYLLIAALIFALAGSLIGNLGALAWSFIAGALFSRSRLGERLVEQRKPMGLSLLLSLAFVPVFLQAHGRSVGNVPLMALLVVGALSVKFAFVWAAAWLSGAWAQRASAVSSFALPSGEVAVVFLAFGQTRWVIGGSEYFAVIGFALLSMLVGPFLWRKSARDKRSMGTRLCASASLDPQGHAGHPHSTEAKKRIGAVAQVIILSSLTVVALLSLSSSARAQVADPTSEDPVARAMASVEQLLATRTRAAEAVLAASKLVDESVAARKRGQSDRANQALREAERITSRIRETDRGALLEELVRLLAAERALSDADSVDLPVKQQPGNVAIKFGGSVLARFNEYGQALADILEEENVPVELLAVALVESGFNPSALSPKGARGIWQFMPATATRYGLVVQSGNDQRTHPIASTRAAARYLRDLYKQFGDWKLALAAYNAGENRVQQVIDSLGIRDFDEMSRRRLLPAETRKYVPSVLSAWSFMKKRTAGDAGDYKLPRTQAVDVAQRPAGIGRAK
jgi:soluble lytic murein transglycosylase-like protein/Kef-type K+ transport system membrane component KefB